MPHFSSHEMSSPGISRSPLASPLLSSSPNDASPHQLSPRSKIKAMLAAIDNESGSDIGTQVTDSGSNISKSSLPRKEHTNEKSNPGEPQFEDDAEDEESDVAPMQPRGRIAARLQGQNMTKDTPGVDEHAGAYERIRLQMLSEPATRARNSSPDSVDPVSGDDRESRGAYQSKKRVSGHSDLLDSPPRRPSTSQRSSLGLFISQKSASSPQQPSNPDCNDGSSSDLPPDPRASNKVLQLVARKRAEREAREAEEARRKHTKKSSARSRPASLVGSEDDIEDIEGERRLTQQMRPTRKASKKALEEMNRETQRMSRNMQLAHQAKTKKRVTKESLFARFNFKSTNPANEGNVETLNSSTAASSTPASDFDGVQTIESPPSSPPQSTNDIELHRGPPKLPELNQSSVMDALNFGIRASMIETPVAHMEDNNEELPIMFEIVNPPNRQVEEGKVKENAGSRGQASKKSTGQASKIREKPMISRPRTRVWPRQPPETANLEYDSDSDLEIMPTRTTKTIKPSVFDRLPAEGAGEGRSLQTLRALAHLTSPSKQSTRSKASMSLAEMQVSLQKRARQQAAAERTEKVQDLKDRGVIVQTAEERERDQVEVEDLLEKARMQAQQIMQSEKRAARAEKNADGQNNALLDTSDEDEDYEDNEADESNIELSGSEEEPIEEEHTDDSEAEAEAVAESDDDKEGMGAAKDLIIPGELVDTEVAVGSDADDADKSVNDMNIDNEIVDLPIQRKRRSNYIINEDEDEDEDDHQLNAGQSQSETVGAIPNPLISGPYMSNGPVNGILGMTQAFAATMAESQTQAIGETPSEDQEQDSIEFLGPMPEPNFPLFDLNDSQPMVLDSQTDRQQDATAAPLADIELHFSRSQVLDVEMENARGLHPTATQYSEIPDPTQDVGFALSSPGPEQRFASIPPSTVDTVVLSRATGEETPKVVRKGRLRRRMVATADDSDSERQDGVNGVEDAKFQISANAFDVLKKSKRKEAPTAGPFDKEKSDAKGMVEEQAQESEDEYAGLGGASDDESGGEEDEEVRKMIEEGEVKVDERELAAFHA